MDYQITFNAVFMIALTVACLSMSHISHAKRMRKLKWLAQKSVEPFVPQIQPHEDVLVSKKIRKQLKREYGNNIRVITYNGNITLRGYVKSWEERNRIAFKAQMSAGMCKVVNMVQVGNALPSSYSFT